MQAQVKITNMFLVFIVFFSLKFGKKKLHTCIYVYIYCFFFVFGLYIYVYICICPHTLTQAYSRVDKYAHDGAVDSVVYMLTFDFFSHFEEAYLQKAEFEIRLVELLILLLTLLLLF